MNNRIENLAINESGFIFDPITGITYTVNEVGRFILERLKDGASTDDIVRAIGEEFESEDKDVYRHTLEFVHNLTENGLIDKSVGEMQSNVQI